MTIKLETAGEHNGIPFVWVTNRNESDKDTMSVSRAYVKTYPNGVSRLFFIDGEPDPNKPDWDIFFT